LLYFLTARLLWQICRAAKEERELILDLSKLVASFVAVVPNLQDSQIDRGNIVEPFDTELGSFDRPFIRRYLQLIFRPDIGRRFEVNDVGFA
jgi:hypothetical protein